MGAVRFSYSAALAWAVGLRCPNTAERKYASFPEKQPTSRPASVVGDGFASPPELRARLTAPTF
jgi:hypothetical protein